MTRVRSMRAEGYRWAAATTQPGSAEAAAPGGGSGDGAAGAGAVAHPVLRGARGVGGRHVREPAGHTGHRERGRGVVVPVDVLAPVRRARPGAVGGGTAVGVGAAQAPGAGDD